MSWSICISILRKSFKILKSTFFDTPLLDNMKISKSIDIENSNLLVYLIISFWTKKLECVNWVHSLSKKFVGFTY